MTDWRRLRIEATTAYKYAAKYRSTHHLQIALTVKHWQDFVSVILYFTLDNGPDMPVWILDQASFL